jgi:hypothetical protein
MVTVLPGAMVATVRHMPGLIARPLRSPELVTPIGFMTQQGMAPTRALLAALELQDDAEWRVQCLRHAGALKDWAVRRAGLACRMGRGVQHGAHRIGRERGGIEPPARGIEQGIGQGGGPGTEADSPAPMGAPPGGASARLRWAADRGSR